MTDSSYDWPNTLWALIEHTAARKTGPEVVQALSRASRKVYGAGIDRAFAHFTRHGLTDGQTAQFDIGWLTVWLLELQQHP